MKLHLLVNIFIAFALLAAAGRNYPIYAAQDPRAVPNNKFGVHILFPSEISDAARLVNSSGGEWGYVTIPIQAGDRDLEKWQGFMDKAKELHMIPLIRLAIENDYFNTRVWRKPTFADVLDFANFLNSLDWPTKNRYIVVFNEPNRGDEWGGDANPSEYAKILSYAATVFRSRSQDFFIITAGLDNAAANNPPISIRSYDFMRQMALFVPDIFKQVDGLGSHSYPNPGFSQPPSRYSEQGVGSFLYERSLAKELGGKDLPVFITETGWSQEKVADYIISIYYKDVFVSLWSDENVVAVTPFLLSANAGPFTVFSLTQRDGSATAQYTALVRLSKIKGTPILSNETRKIVLENLPKSVLGMRDFSNQKIYLQSAFAEIKAFKTLLKWLLKL
ncbi:MAG: hypothetical protein HYY87_01190 [Candidatus Levybacteria bacterium]|nr:hypothetical protein [Candidatus Levybacteria bacterium]